MTEQLTRTCFKCGETKPIWAFPRNDSMQSGRDIRCVDCVRKHRAQFESKCIEKFNRQALKQETRRRRYSQCKF